MVQQVFELLHFVNLALLRILSFIENKHYCQWIYQTERKVRSRKRSQKGISLFSQIVQFVCKVNDKMPNLPVHKLQSKRGKDSLY